MSSKPPIAYINIRVFAHATEDPEKVQTAIRNILPQEMVDTLVFEKSNLAGHYGNSIVLFTATLTDKKLLPNALEKIGAGLSSLDKDAVCTDFKLHVEKSNLYLRFDKQSAYLGNIKFTQNDPIHFKIHFKHKSVAEIESLSRTAGLLP
jgi:RNA binding exosome subunit